MFTHRIRVLSVLHGVALGLVPTWVGAVETDPAILESGYRRVVEMWAGGDSKAAVAELIRFESAAVDDEDPRSRERLHKAEQRILSELAGSDLEVLPPLSLLHQEAYRHYADHGGRGSALVASHDRMLAFDLAYLYNKHVGTSAAAELASRLIARLGSVVTDSFQAAKLFNSALDLDPRNAAAALGLGTVFEKNGAYEDAIAAFRRLLAAEPGHPEGRLRLALCLVRMERTAEAEKLLAELASVPPSPWIGLLASEQLAALHLEAKAPEKAEKVVRAGLERFPSSARLVVLLASVLDRKGDFQGGRAALEKLTEIGGEPAEDSRYRYNRLSEELFADADRAVAAAGADRLPALARALAPAAPASDGVAR